MSDKELTEEELIAEFTEDEGNQSESVDTASEQKAVNSSKDDLVISSYQNEDQDNKQYVNTDLDADEPIISNPPADPPLKPEVIDLCKEVLAKNQHGDYTVPASDLYPHQWLWDSCFVAIGLAEYDIERAKKEIQSLLRGQWANGMIPNIIFADGDEHHRDRNIWQSWRNPYAPENISTTGITQPPMLAEAVARIGKKLNLAERRRWYQQMYPSLLEYHEWLYKERDPHQEGLVLLIHPYECGLDNTPPWINQLHQHHKPWWISLIEKTHADSLGNLFRRDTKRIPPGQRISNIEALMYYNIIRRLRGKNWDIESILARSHFVVQDLSYNCILLRAGEILKDIAKTIGHDLPEELLESMERGKETLEKLWDGYSGQYYSRNFITHRLIKEPSLATLMPLYSGIVSKERAEQLVEILKSPKNFDTAFPIASVPITSEWYKELDYWQGPTWINTNWLIADGLERYGYGDEANRIRGLSVELVKRHGCNEYFSALSGEPAGANNFSWTAALTINMINNNKGVK